MIGFFQVLHVATLVSSLVATKLEFKKMNKFSRKKVKLYNKSKNKKYTEIEPSKKNKKLLRLRFSATPHVTN